MRITPFGAAGGEVTGSCYLIETRDAAVLVDLGLFQGGRQKEEMNRLPRGIDGQRLDAVLLTHGHLDHCGRLPLLPGAGFAGPVYMTPATVELIRLILQDTARLMARQSDGEIAWRDRPLYTQGDVNRLLRQCRPVPYDTLMPVAPGVHARWVEAGHVLGSASIEVTVKENGSRKVVVFSGDLGPYGSPLLKDAVGFDRADAVFLESTYGDRDHRPYQDTVEEFFQIVRRAVEQRGRILVPTFAVGRAQVLLALLAWAFMHKRLPSFPVYLDSPMAIEATRMYQRHPELMDAETLAFARQNPEEALRRSGSRTTPSPRESQALRKARNPCMILAGAGMCTGGRILYHLANHLDQADTQIIIVGFQAPGTLGRQLVDKAPQVTLFGRRLEVRAQVHTLGGFSAHAGQSDLLNWFTAMADDRPRVFLVHGEDRARTALAAKIRERFGLSAELAKLKQPLPI